MFRMKETECKILLIIIVRLVLCWNKCNKYSITFFFFKFRRHFWITSFVENYYDSFIFYVLASLDSFFWNIEYLFACSFIQSVFFDIFDWTYLFATPVYLYMYICRSIYLQAKLLKILSILPPMFMVYCLLRTIIRIG